MSRPNARLPKFASRKDALELVGRLGGEFAIIKNPGYVQPPYEACPLAKKLRRLPRGLAGIVKDMDGTTTTTEALCLHSLETMVRRITGRLDSAVWAGLDRTRDYPHIIGNSTTRHVEYLIETYQKDIRREALERAYVEAAVWTLAFGHDPGRRAEVENNIVNLGLRGIREDRDFKALASGNSLGGEAARRGLDRLARRFSGAFRLEEFAQVVRAAIDIYYYRYHEILAAVKEGRGAELSRLILREPGRSLIEPMPGVAVFLCLVRGWLGGAEAQRLFDFPGAQLASHLAAHGMSKARSEAARGRFARLAEHLARHPARIAVVTSSIEYEAAIVLGEVFRVVREQIAAWPLAARVRERLAARFESPAAYYDAMITASDSSEIRLKPHRDLYSIALHRLGLKPEEFDCVIGFEDSESGTIAIRAAGVGCCVAVPFADTSGHDLSAASVVARGGLPEVMVRHALFLPDSVLEK